MAATLAAWPTSAPAAKPVFESRSLPVKPAKLHDVVVTDIEGDHDVDLFAMNHKFRGTLLVGDGMGGFTDRYYGSGLSATAHVPGFDDLFREPAIGPAGLYMWVDRDGFTHIRTERLGEHPKLPHRRVRGEIRYLGRSADLRRARGAQVEVSTDRSARPPTGVVSFNAGSRSEIVIRANFMDLPFEVSIEERFPRQRILLGPGLVHPPDHDFEIDLGDRHGAAWADFDQDGFRDVYITNGGNRGAVSHLGGLTQDELYRGDGQGGFTEGIADAGIDKGFCRGRYAAPVDYDTDGDLDIFVGCEQARPLLFQQKRVAGRFGSRSHQLAGADGGLYRWLDLDRDRSPELVVVRRRKIRVYEHAGGDRGFTLRQKLRARRQGKTPDVISFADVDRDLDPDLFIGSRGGNTLLLNRSGRLRATRPSRRGLPDRGTVAASFIDYDNDGRLDFHSAPQGIFRGRGGGKFRRTGKLKVGGRAHWATSTWVDLDADGDRDLVSLLKRQGIRLRRRIEENRTRDRHWLTVDLRGDLGNIEAVGARVIVRSRRGARAGWVGEAEGSRFSTGHYTVYFGLGRDAVARKLTVVWPDGGRTVLRDVPADQRLIVER